MAYLLEPDFGSMAVYLQIVAPHLEPHPGVFEVLAVDEGQVSWYGQPDDSGK